MQEIALEAQQTTPICVLYNRRHTLIAVQKMLQGMLSGASAPDDDYTGRPKCSPNQPCDCEVNKEVWKALEAITEAVVTLEKSEVVH